MLSNAALLDELMGRDRNLAPNEERPKLKWEDEQVCKYYLVEYCPHDLFTNTRADLGLCSKLHDDELKKQYQESTRRFRMGYEDQFVSFLQSMISDVERRINKGRMRLQLNNHPPTLSKNLPAEENEKSIVLTDRIEELLSEAEKLGCEGQVEESQGIMRLAEQLKKERDDLQNAQQDQTVPQMKEMEVCDICGAFLIVGDAKSRAEEHLMGKQHMGYAKIRITVTDMEEAKTKRENERSERLRQERAEREAQREKEREDRKKEREERHKKLDDERRERRRRSRSRSRDRRRRSRSRSRDRRRSRSRDRRRSRSRDRRRSRSRDRRRSRSRRSRSRDRSSRHSSRRSRSRERSSRRGSRDRRSRERSRRKSGSREKSSGGEGGKTEKKEETVKKENESSDQVAPEGNPSPTTEAESAEKKPAESTGGGYWTPIGQ